MRVLLEAPDVAASPISCSLVGIERNQIHLRTPEWVKPGSRGILKFARLIVPGEVGSSNRHQNEYDTCFVSENNRRAPRIAVDEPAYITILDDSAASSAECRLKDISRYGLSLSAALSVKIGSTVCVESDFMVAIGEVRHRMLDAGDAFRVGVEIVEMLSDETAPRRLRSLRHKLAERILEPPHRRALINAVSSDACRPRPAHGSQMPPAKRPRCCFPITPAACSR